MRRVSLRRAAVCAAFTAMSVSALGSSARADFGIAAFDGAVLDVQGQAFTQAGGHPAIASTSFSLNRQIVNGTAYPDGGELKDVIVDLPPGFIGNPMAVPACPKDRRIPSDEELLPEASASEFCPVASIVGRAVATNNQLGLVRRFAAPVFALEPPPGVAAQFGFSIANQRTYLDATVRNDGDYGIRVRVRKISQAQPVLGGEVTLWGVPADPSHDALRCMGFPALTEDEPLPDCDPNDPLPLLRPSSVTGSLSAFITNPTKCTPPGVGLETLLDVSSWVPGIPGDQASFLSHKPPGYPLAPAEWGEEVGVTGCEKLPFQSALDVRPDSTRPDSSTGLEVALAMSQDAILNPAGLSSAHLKRVAIAFPEGLTVNPSSANGLQACTDEQLGIGRAAPASCPEASKIGSATAVTPLLKEQLRGELFVGSQKSDDPESGDLFRIFVTLNNTERGIAVKLRGNVRADADNGRLEATFDDNPQVPVSNIAVRLKGGDRAPLATPPTCGPHLVQSAMASWGGQTSSPADDFGLACVGARGFAPSFTAGGANTTGGAFSPFSVAFARQDGEQYLSGVGVTLPGGLLARLKDVPLCGSAQAEAGRCPLESRVGTATVGAGTGAHPYYVKGSVSLTGPYRGAPYGLAVAVRAVAGPFDLGMVVVRQAIYVDPTDGHLTVVSDPLPRVVKGVPLRLRTAHVAIDRPGFTLNPTSCATKRINATFVADTGARANGAERFEVGNCGSLPFSPKMTMRLTGKGQITGGKHPGLKTVVTQDRNQAHIRKVKVTLPLSLALDPNNPKSDELCEFEEGRKADPRCPRSSIVGSAVARTPLLNRPLKGRVYFVKNVRISKLGRRIRTLPTLLVALRGEVSLNVRGETNVDKDGRLVTTFPVVPDAPVSRFELTIKGGSGGILTVSRGNLCRRKQVTSSILDAHSGKRLSRPVKMDTPCARR